jgi:hypothetical protein
VINRSVEINHYQKIHSDLIRTINFREDELTLRPADSLTLSRTGDDESVMTPTDSSLAPDEKEEMKSQPLPPLPSHIRSVLAKNFSHGWKIYDPVVEFGRMGIPDALWRISDVNESYSVCPTYPATVAVPMMINDDQLTQASLFRSRGRFPALSWRHPHNFCSLTRCSQPLVGLGQNRSYYDELLLEAINQAGTYPSGDDMINLASTPYKSLLMRPQEKLSPVPHQMGENKRPLVIIDARPKINAQANQAAGKGYEIGKGYENCRVLFMNIANIHVMRKSIDSLEEVCCKWTTADDSWHKNVESTGWLSHVSRVLSASVRIVHCVALEEFSVLVHCSDGWDRTAQLTSLPMLLMDPFYRTYEGFMILIEKEWFSFGHKFADRLGWSENGWHDEERSPVFQQFLDCVFQCLHQRPNIFEFNEKLLLFLATQVLTGWFGNIFSNCEMERISSGVMHTTLSLWSHLHSNPSEFQNPHYHLYPHLWVPNSQPRRMVIWKQWFLRWHNQIWELSWKKKNEDFSDLVDGDGPGWMEDNAVKECCGCHRQFNFVYRRHHCRACGKIYCESCVKQTRIVLTVSETLPVRCCDECVAVMDIQESAAAGQNKQHHSKLMSTSKRSGRSSAFSIDSEMYSLPSAKRSSMRIRRSRPSISFDQFQPTVSQLKRQSTTPHTCEEEVEDDDDGDALSEISSIPSPQSSPKSNPRSSPSPRMKTSFPFNERDMSRGGALEEDRPISMRSFPAPIGYPSADRPRSTSYNTESALPLRTSMRYEKIKPNNNPLALTTLGNKNRIKKTER